MAARKWLTIVIGALLLLFGSAWALQGGGMMGGSSLMDGNPTFIYIGSITAIIGIALLMVGARSRPKVPTS